MLARRDGEGAAGKGRFTEREGALARLLETNMIGLSPRRRLMLAFAPILALLAIGCNRSRTADTTLDASPRSGSTTASEFSAPRESGEIRDLSVDESMGGHTLARHVGRTDAELSERLRREPQISSASTYTDRRSAERAVGAALASAGPRLANWENRSGRRPNLVLHYVDRGTASVGRSLSREQQTPVLCHRILIVLRWDERTDRFYVLTSYPEAGR